MKHLAASNILESLLVLIHSGGEGGLVRKGGVWGWKGVFANPFAACYVKPTAKTMGGNGRRVEWYKANRATQRGFVRSTLSSFRSLPPSLNFPPALFTTHRRVTFSKLLRLLYSHACLFSCYAVLLSRLCENPLRIHVHFLALSSLSLSHLLFRPCEILRFQAPCQSHALDIGHSSRSSETRFFMHFIVHWFFWLYIYICTFGWLSPFF